MLKKNRNYLSEILKLKSKIGRNFIDIFKNTILLKINNLNFFNHLFSLSPTTFFQNLLDVL